MLSFKKWLCIALASLTMFSSAVAFTGCANTTENEEPAVSESAASTAGQTETTTDSGKIEESGESGETAAVEETEPADTRFENVNYGGRKFLIHTSANLACTGMGESSNFLIEGPEKSTGSIVSDAALERNLYVEKILNVDLQFFRTDLVYTDVAAEVRKLTTAGDNDFDLIINDLFPFAQLSIEGQFTNLLENKSAFDFDRSYWYRDYMEDLRLQNDYQHLMAGDYFIDVLRSAHLLLLNKQIYKDYYHEDPDVLYDMVLNYEWTYDKMNEIISGVYQDKNPGGIKDKGDVFGFITCEYWGGSIAYTVSGNPTFIERDPDTGEPTVILGQSSRAPLLCTAMSNIFNNDHSSVGMTGETELLQAFANDECLILDYQRLGSLENTILRSMKGDACVLPYPLLMESDRKYTTSAHDTTEVGAILISSSEEDFEFITTVIEVLNRETANILMPKYYKDGLQVQYVDDSKSAQMIDIIHDNFDNSFVLAYNESLGQMMLQPFATAMQEKREFGPVYNKNDVKIGRKLSDAIKTFEKNNN